MGGRQGRSGSTFACTGPPFCQGMCYAQVRASAMPRPPCVVKSHILLEVLLGNAEHGGSRLGKSINFSLAGLGEPLVYLSQTNTCHSYKIKGLSPPHG